MARLPRVTAAERIMVQVPFTPRVSDWNDLLVPEWRILQITRVRTEDPEVVGYGESCYVYTSGNSTEETRARVVGENPASLLKDDSLGLDLQMALYDAAGKAMGLPVHALLPLPKVRDWCPLGWWNTDMPPEALAGEAADAYAKGYRFHKLKARPWIDVYAQADAVMGATPDDFLIDFDWNDMLLHAANAVPVLRELDNHPRAALYEGPIPQRDIEGYRELRSKVAKPVAIHFGLPPFPTAIRESMCDGFVVFGGVTDVLTQGILCAAFEKPFFLQQVGAGLTTAMISHLGAVLTHARWPAITVMNNYADDLLAEPLVIRSGGVRTPDGPGLGVTVSEDALERYRMDPPYRLPEPRHILTVTWPGGRRVRYARMASPRPAGAAPYSHLRYGASSGAESGRQCWEDFLAGNHPVQERGARLTVWKDDGSAEWAALYARVNRGPVME